MDLGLILRHVCEGTIYSIAVAIASKRRVARQTRHALAGLARAFDRGTVVTVLDAQPAFAGLVGSGEWIEPFVGPNYLPAPTECEIVLARARTGWLAAVPLSRDVSPSCVTSSTRTRMNRGVAPASGWD